jgi:hypothetical protein
MEESKLKEIEAKLQELFAQNDREKSDPPRIKNTSRRGVRVIRRRKGQPDHQLA